MFKKTISISLLIFLSMLIFQCDKNEKVSAKSSNNPSNVNLTDGKEVAEIVEEKIVPIKYSSFILPKEKKDSAVSVFFRKIF